MYMNRNDSYEYESEELDEEKEERRRKLIKGIFFSILVIIVVIIVLLLLKGCGKTEVNRYDDLVKAAKAYYEEEKDKLPEFYGEQATVTLKDLKDADLLENPDAFSDCTDASTYVKVSKLESGKYQYTPVLNCKDEETAFGSCIVGTEKDLEADSSNVEFTFVASRLQKGIKEYYPGNKTDESKVKEYYKTAPSADYNLTDDKGVTGYKYYKTVAGGKEYWNNGAYAESAPSGYPNKGAAGTITYYRKKIVAKKMFKCLDDTKPSFILSGTPCHLRDNKDFLIADTSVGNTLGVVTSCDGVNIVHKDTVCTDWTNWSTTVCSEGDDNQITGVRCQSKQVTAYKWYKETSSYKSYYPSNKTNASDENTYYIEAPADGYVKDESSKATVYRFYKFTELKDDDNKATVEEWVKINEKAVSKDEMLKSLEELKYEIKTLKDIEENENLKYEVVFKYCNRK